MYLTHQINHWLKGILKMDNRNDHLSPLLLLLPHPYPPQPFPQFHLLAPK